MVMLAFVFGFYLAARRGKAMGVSTEAISDLTLWIMVGSLAGARLTYVIAHWREFEGRWLDAISPIQSDGTIGIAGLVVLGGVAAAIPIVIWQTRKRGLRFLQVADVMMPSLAFGLALGRIGCHLNGCCFGTPTDLPWGLRFPETCLAGAVYPGKALHPTQLYESLYAAGIGIALILRTPYRRFEGELFHLFLVLYGIFRFFNEIVRHYDARLNLFEVGGVHFTGSMAGSLLMIGVGVYNLLQGGKAGRRAG